MKETILVIEIEAINIRTYVCILNFHLLHESFSVFDARLPATTTTLGTNNDIQFPGETKLNYSEVRGTAQIIIPAVVIDQFSREGKN